MKSITNLVGKKFNCLEVLELSKERDNLGKPLWLCRCECGKELFIRTSTLKGGIVSCGCKFRESIRDPEMALNQKYAHYKRDAKSKKVDFTLDKGKFKMIIQENCYYCGRQPRLWSPYIGKDGNPLNKYKGKVDYNYMISTSIAINGLDRIDSTKGYTEDNVLPCCRQCNYMKNTYTQNEFLTQVQRIYLKALADGTLLKIPLKD